MQGSDKYLEMFLALIEKIDQDNGNKDFSFKIYQSMGSKFNNLNGPPSSDFSSVYSDLKRTKYYLRHIDRTEWLEGFHFYSGIKIPELKIELAKDYKELKIADKEDNIIEYARRLVMQLENCVNSVIEIVDGHTQVENNSKNFIDRYNNLWRGNYSFFNDDGSRKDVSIISLPSKIFFSKQYYSFNYFYKDLDEMIKIRNKASHRGDVSTKEQIIIDNAIKNVTQKKADYFKTFNTIIKNLKDLYHKIFILIEHFPNKHFPQP